jgi:hypothetical protein
VRLVANTRSSIHHLVIIDLSSLRKIVKAMGRQKAQIVDRQCERQSLIDELDLSWEFKGDSKDA